MRKIELNMNEQNKYEIIKNLVDKNGNKKSSHYDWMLFKKCIYFNE